MKDDQLYFEYLVYLNWRLKFEELSKGKYSLLKISKSSFDQFKIKIENDDAFREKIKNIYISILRDEKINNIFI